MCTCHLLLQVLCYSEYHFLTYWFIFFPIPVLKIALSYFYFIPSILSFSSIFINIFSTGYLVRLVAHAPQVFNNHTHLIIDEVHERSIDGDLLCLLSRRLLSEYPKLKLILMSATLHTELYKQYFHEFNTPYDIECLSVGCRRFPLDVKYVEDILKGKDELYYPPKLEKSLLKLVEVNRSNTGRQQVGMCLDLFCFVLFLLHFLCFYFDLFFNLFYFYLLPQLPAITINTPTTYYLYHPSLPPLLLPLSLPTHTHYRMISMLLLQKSSMK